MKNMQAVNHYNIFENYTFKIINTYPKGYLRVFNIRHILVGNCIFILNLTLGFNGLSKDNYKMGRETFKFWDLVRLILEILR